MLKFNPNHLWVLSNDAELALIQQDSVRCQQRIAQALTLVDNKNQIFAILPFLAWIAEPESSYQPILEAIENLENDVKVGWGFSTLEPTIIRLTAE